MRPYGSYDKRLNKLHAHNECSICNDKPIPCKKRARQTARKQIKDTMTVDRG